MAGHIMFNSLRDGDGIPGEQFFLKSIVEMEKELLEEFNKFNNNEETNFKIIELPGDYLDEEEKINGYKAYVFNNVQCSEDAVWGGKCSIELHYKSKEKYVFYAVA